MAPPASDDSQYDNLDLAEYEDPTHVIVSGAGNPSVNGAYIQDGHFESACRYVMEGSWNGTRYKFYMFLCNVSNYTRHWYISIAPFGGSTGTSADIDFYTAPMTSESSRVPPQTGWVKANEGTDPVPRLEYRFADGAPKIVGNGNMVEDDNDDAIEGGPYV
jgi:ubiquitin carboxyl-terminal hydrolase 9/24